MRLKKSWSDQVNKFFSTSLRLRQNKFGFTLIELLVVIAIIGLLATLSVLALQNARINSRDAKRLADVKQLRSALELYYNDAGHYPSAAEFNSGKIEYYTPGIGTSTYMMQIPSAPTPADGACSNAENAYTYLPDSDGTTYVLNFCIAKNNGDLPAGKIIAHPGGLSWSGQGSGDNGGDFGGDTFEVTVGGSGYQYAASIQSTADGGYIIAGETDSDGTDVYVAKLNADGSLNSSFGNSGELTIGDSGYQNAYDVQITSDGGYITIGETDINGGDIYVAKTTSAGVLDSSFGTAGVLVFGGDGSQRGSSIQPTADGGYIIAGTTSFVNSGDMYVAKLNSDGSMDNSFGVGGVATIGGAGTQSGYSVQIAPDGDYVIAGNTDSNMSDIYVVKLNPDGSLDSNFGTNGEVIVGDGNSQGTSFMQVAADGGYIIVGPTDSNNVDIYIVKLNPDGSLDSGFGSGGIITVGDGDSQQAQSVQNTVDGGYIVGGYTTANGDDMYIVKLNANGSLDSNFGTNGIATFGDSGSQWCYSIETTTDGGYIAAGETDANGGDAYIVKMDGNGVVSGSEPETPPVTGSWSTVSESNISGAKSGSNWQAIISSADGTKLLASAWDMPVVYASNDSGSTWTTYSAPAGFYSMAASSDNSKIVAASTNAVYVSTDYGQTWTYKAVAGISQVRDLASSADGTKLALVDNSSSGYIYTSSDSGNTWVQRASAGFKQWSDIDSSADGTKLIAGTTGGAEYIYISTDSGATWTAQTSLGARNWLAVSSSADGTKLAAAAATGYIYISTDSGATWAQRATFEAWLSLSSSADGTKLVAVDYGGYVYTSIDSGVTWSAKTSSGLDNWVSAAISDDGVKIAAVSSSGYINVSNNSGQNWNMLTDVGPRWWSSIASSADGTKLAVVARQGRVYISSDSGTTWTESNSPYSYSAEIASSADGSKLVLAGDHIYTSTDSGSTWTEQSGFGTVDSWWSNIESSADGTKLIAVDASAGSIYTSVDSGVTWTERTGAGQRNWRTIASSADGTKLAAAEFGGYIYTSSNSGATWTEQTGSGARSWASVAMSADGTKLIAANLGGRLYTSADSGATWVERTGANPDEWSAVASSDDGTKLIASAGNYYSLDNEVYVSTDSGVTWTAQGAVGVNGWLTVSISSTGGRMAAASLDGKIVIYK